MDGATWNREMRQGRHDTGVRGVGEQEEDREWDGYETCAPADHWAVRTEGVHAPELPSSSGGSGHLGTFHPPSKEAQLLACPAWC